MELSIQMNLFRSESQMLMDLSEEMKANFQQPQENEVMKISEKSSNEEEEKEEEK